MSHNIRRVHAVKVTHDLRAVVGCVTTQFALEAPPTKMAHCVAVQVRYGAIVAVAFQTHQFCVIDHSTDSFKVTVTDSH